ncbi:MAG: VWA domain-containing protein [Gammaproteobacteria bacterium]|nr:VWA domain-containing protein [Gammaproteobacteria bacterium]
MSSWLYETIGLHFIRPWAWLLLIPLIILFFWQVTHRSYHSNWSDLIDQHLLQWILPNSENRTRKRISHSLLLAFWLLLVFALSGPSWQKIPQPIYSNNDANVIVLDLSSSMDANDIEPTRLARSKFKLYDLLEKIAEGNTALIVYAGDAFILSPLTSDERTIENLIRPLQTELMPIKGSQPQLGIAKAIELLQNAEQVNGNIIWVTDGAEAHQLDDIESLLDKHQYRLKILATGTEQGAPITMAAGRFLKDSQGNIVVPKLNYAELAQFSDQVGATLTAISADSHDIEVLSQSNLSPLEGRYQKEDIFADSWHDSGYWLLILLIPIVLYSFRNKNILAVLLVSCFVTMTPYQSAEAQVTDKLFLNKDQQGQKHYKNGDLESAEKNFQDPNWKAMAAYKNGNYQAAAGYLSQATNADELYNLGNALAMAGQYQEAINAYQAAIDLQADHADAIYNKKVIEDLLEQEQQDSQSEQEQQEQQQQQEQEQQEQQEQEQQQQEQESQQQESEQQEQEKQTQEQQLKEMSEQEKQQELEQWLKKISDDPGRLIRNKMKLEYNRRGYRSQPSKTW